MSLKKSNSYDFENLNPPRHGLDFLLISHRKFIVMDKVKIEVAGSA